MDRTRAHRANSRVLSHDWKFAYFAKSFGNHIASHPIPARGAVLRRYLHRTGAGLDARPDGHSGFLGRSPSEFWVDIAAFLCRAVHWDHDRSRHH